MGLVARLYERAYRSGRNQWDTGVTPPGVVEEVSAMGPGRALDLGCGTGTNVLWLARRGWIATGVDASALARYLRPRRFADRLQDRSCRLHRFDLTQSEGCHITHQR